MLSVRIMANESLNPNGQLKTNYANIERLLSSAHLWRATCRASAEIQLTQLSMGNDLVWVYNLNWLNTACLQLQALQKSIGKTTKKIYRAPHFWHIFKNV